MQGGLLATRLRPSPVSPPPSAAGPPPGSEEPPVPPELPATPPSWPGLGRLGLTQAIGGLALGLIALLSSYDHLTIAGRNIPIHQQWGIPLIAASVAIGLSMLNWRRDPDYEQRVMQHEQRMNENRIAIERSKERIKQIENETELLRQENAKLRQLNDKERALSDSIRRLCFPPASSSIPQTPIEPGFKPFLPS